MVCLDNLGNIQFDGGNYESAADNFELSLQMKIKLHGHNNKVTGIGYFLCGKSW